MNLILLLVGFVALIYSADRLIDGASSLAKNFRVPDIVIGLTVVAFGTSAPELAVNVYSSFVGKSELVMGNVLGSNIFNVCGILGITSIVHALSIQRSTVWLEIPFNFLSILVVSVMGLDMLVDGATGNALARSEGIVLLAFFLIFLVYNIQLSLQNPSEEGVYPTYSTLRSIFLLVFGLVGLAIGGRLIVYSATNLAANLGISDRVIGLTVVSIGTSLPELATSLIAVRKKVIDIAVGNVVGSNIFNIFLVLGISSTVRPVYVDPDSAVDFGLNIFLGILLFVFAFTGKKFSIERWEGIILVLVYLIYLILLILQIGI